MTKLKHDYYVNSHVLDHDVHYS